MMRQMIVIHKAVQRGKDTIAVSDVSIPYFLSILLDSKVSNDFATWTHGSHKIDTVT